MTPRFTLALASTLLLATAALANETAAPKTAAKPASKPHPTASAKPAAPAMTDAQKAQMEAYMKAATPGAEHMKLDDFAGSFDAKVSSWGDPSAKPEITTGVMTSNWVLGKRWIEQHYSGSMMGQPFKGVGYIGYDNTTKQYVSTWMDTMSTSCTVATGSVDATGKIFTLTGSMTDPTSGKSMNVRQVATIVDHDHQTFEMYAPGPDGKEAKMMEISYTRKAPKASS